MIGRCYDYTARSTSEMRCDLWHDSGHAGYTVQRQRTEACRCRQVNSKFKPIYQCKAHEPGIAKKRLDASKETPSPNAIRCSPSRPKQYPSRLQRPSKSILRTVARHGRIICCQCHPSSARVVAAALAGTLARSFVRQQCIGRSLHLVRGVGQGQVGRPGDTNGRHKGLRRVS